MTSLLAEVQSLFARAIQATAAVGEQPDARCAAPLVVAGNARLSPLDQLEIYREQFWLRHVGALEEDFATLVQLLGHTEFHGLAERYLVAHPCDAFSLRDLGAHLPSFLVREAPYCEDTLLADCARLEWAFVEAFDAADAPPVSPEAIAAIPEDGWSGTRVSLHPALQLLALGHPAHEYRALVRAGTAAPRPAPAPVRLAVYRGPESLQYVAVEPLAFDLLALLARGEPLGAACEIVSAGVEGSDIEADLEASVGRWFRSWTAAGWLTGVSCP